MLVVEQNERDGGDRADPPRAQADPAQRLEGGLEQRVAALGQRPGGRMQRVDRAAGSRSASRWAGSAPASTTPRPRRSSPAWSWPARPPRDCPMSTHLTMVTRWPPSSADQDQAIYGWSIRWPDRTLHRPQDGSVGCHGQHDQLKVRGIEPGPDRSVLGQPSRGILLRGVEE